MLFSNTSELPEKPPTILTFQGKQIKLVSSYKYLGFLIDNELFFNAHIANLVSKLKVKFGFYFRNKSCFSLRARKLLLAFLRLWWCVSDALCLDASQKCLQSLHTAYHCALRFVTGCKRLTHHCTLYAKSTVLLWMYAGTHIAWVFFIKLFPAWFLLIYLHITKEPKAVMPCVPVIFYNCLSLVFAQSWEKEHLVSLPPVRGTHSKIIWNSLIFSRLRTFAPSEMTDSVWPLDSGCVFLIVTVFIISAFHLWINFHIHV